MATGAEMLALAGTRVGQAYKNVLVPKNNSNWSGPWDCAEFMSWLVYQVGDFLYGCTDPKGHPALTEAYTGAWKADSLKRGQRVDVAMAASTPGGILLRYPPQSGAMGHIAIADGQGKVIEAHSTKEGVTDHFGVKGRVWDTGVFIPGFEYAPGAAVDVSPPAFIYKLGAPNMRSAVVRALQSALAEAGFDPGPIDGLFGPNTATAVAAFQASHGLVADGQVGATTAKALKVNLQN